MSSPLLAPLERLRRRARRILLVRGVGLCLATSVTSTALAVGLDWLFHLDDSEHRGLILLGVLLVHLAAIWHWLIAPLRTPLSDLALATRLEQRFPELQDQLSSGLQFSRHHGDPRIGSPTLQREVIDSTVEVLGHIDIGTVVEPRTARRAALVASGIAALGLTLAACNPLDASTGLGRLFLLSTDQWPRKVDLQFLDGTLSTSSWDGQHGVRIPTDESIQLLVVNTRGDLPADSIVELRHATDQHGAERLLAVQPLARSTQNDTTDAVRDVGTTVLTPPEGFQALEFRARGGDGTTPWIPLAIIPPPLLESLSIVLHPPAYTRRPVQRLPEGHGDIEAWIGTRAEISAVINQPIREATLVRGDLPPLPVSITADGRTLTAQFTVQTPGVSNWFLALVDRDGLTAERPEQFELRGLVDRLPEVELVEPPGNIQATPRAKVPLEITAHDDLGLASVHLVIRPINLAGGIEKRVLLHGEHLGDGLLLFDHEWQLADESPRPGMEFDVHIEATDACDFTSPRIGRSATRTISIVSPAAKRDQLEARQSALLGQLAGLLQRQHTAHSRIVELVVQCETAGRLRPGDREILLATEADQQQLNAQLATADSGLALRARRLMSERHANHIDDPAALRDLERIADDLEELGKYEFPELEAALAESRRHLDSSAVANPEQILKTISGQQDRVITVLGSLVRDLAPAQDRRERLGEARRIIQQQQQLLNDTGSRPEQTLDQPTRQLTRQQQADLRRMARQQNGLAEQLDRLSHRLAPDPDDEKPADSSTGRLSKAHTDLRKAGTVAAMRESAADIERNHLGESQQAQQSILEQLTQLERSLQDDANVGDQTILAKLDRLLARVRQLTNAQTSLQADTTRAADRSASDVIRSRLRTRQAGLGRDAQQIVDSTRPLGSPRTRAVARGAANAMTRAREGLRQPDSANALSAQATAIEKLELLERLLTEQHENTTTSLANEQTRRVGQDLSRIRTRQGQLAEQTRSLEDDRQRTARWTRPLLKRLRKLAQQQASVVEETRRVRWPETADDAPRRVQGDILEQMQLAAESLERRHTGPLAQQPQQQALAQLDRWLSQTRNAIPQDSAGNTTPMPTPPPPPPPSNQPGRSAGPGDSPLDPTDAVSRPGLQPADQTGSSARVGKVVGKVRLNALRRAPWGKLPPTLRHRLSQSGRERTPARYSELVHRYYESLAGRRGPDGNDAQKDPR